MTLDIPRWYRTVARPVLTRIDPGSIAELDRLAAHIEQIERQRGARFPICLLGQAGVGKSTLINTLVADAEIIVPSGGGTGPLTAHALHVRHGEQPAFRVRYHSAREVKNIRFVLETELGRRDKAQAAAAESDEEHDLALNLAQDEDTHSRSRIQENISRAALLATGAQSADRTLQYLIDALRVMLGERIRFDTTFQPEDLQRLSSIQKVLRTDVIDDEFDFHSATHPDFRQRLRDHAAGFMAPLIREMVIEWPSPVLQSSVELVDLPGIGIVNDSFREVTADYMRNRARGVLLVTDSRGLRVEDAALLRDSGFLNRLLHSADDPAADPIILLVAVVRVDDVAEENFRNERAMLGAGSASKAEHFRRHADRSRDDVRKRISELLEETWERDTPGKASVLNSIAQSMQVFPISSIQYRRLIAPDPDDGLSFLKEISDTNIPALRDAIASLAHEALTESQRRYEGLCRRFLAAVRARLNLLAAQAEEHRSAESDAQAFAGRLTQLAEPIRREYDLRRGRFGNFLRSTVPVQIEGKLTAASNKARENLAKYLKDHERTHWRTLQAAVRREGAFNGKININLVQDFTLKYEEPVAELWSREILQFVRKETMAFSTYLEDAVTKLLDVAQASGAPTSAALLEAIRDNVRSQREGLEDVGANEVRRIRKVVRTELVRTIENPIRESCRRFVEAHQDVGAGVKSRIHELFRELANEVVTAAYEPTHQLLLVNYESVADSITQSLGASGDPLQNAFAALSATNTDRSDAESTEQHARAAEIRSLVEQMPELALTESDMQR